MAKGNGLSQQQQKEPIEINSIRAGALKRNFYNSKLDGVKDLEKLEWAECDDFWGFLADSPEEAILKQWKRITLPQLRATTYHEAGHFVLAYLLGYEITSATVVPKFGTRSCYDGEVGIRRVVKTAGDSCPALKEIMVLYAGGCAEYQYHHGNVAGDWGCSEDKFAAKKIAQCITSDYTEASVFMRNYLALTYHLISNPIVKRTVGAIAQMFFRTGVINVEEGTKLVYKMVIASNKVPKLITEITKFEANSAKAVSKQMHLDLMDEFNKAATAMVYKSSEIPTPLCFELIGKPSWVMHGAVAKLNSQSRL